MIQLLATKYNKHIAYCFFLMLWMGFIPPRTNAAGYIPRPMPVNMSNGNGFFSGRDFSKPKSASLITPPADLRKEKPVPEGDSVSIDGPGQPEMSSFQAAGTNNMVNLFTGDFSYNIPLLDVGGYPVNIFYNGGVTPEQEASWVGLGWNINPGNVNRNMRGVADDFNGEDVLKQYQQMKPNKTWGFRFGPDFELGGVKAIDVSVTLGASFNNYLGPALELGVKGGVNGSVGMKIFGEKAAPTDLDVKLSAGAGLNANTRNGVTASANASLTARFHKSNLAVSGGLGLGLNYNSRIGIKGLELTEQMSYNYTQAIRVAKGVYNLVETGDNFRLSSHISFNRPSYLPVMRAVTTNSANSFHVQFGTGFLNTGIFTSIETEAYYQNSAIKNIDTLRQSPLYGYLYYDRAAGKKNAVMDMTRYNDREVTPSTPVISVPQYTYDVFTIQGEGTGGSVRAYRNDLGYVRDNLTTSRDESSSGGADVGPPSHVGLNFNSIHTPSSIGDWEAGNKLRTAIPFRSNTGLSEAVYFKSPGESSVVNAEQMSRIGGTDLVRFKLGGSNANPTIEPVLERFDGEGQILGTEDLSSPFIPDRKKRTQVVNFLTAEEASYVGLNKKIESYNSGTLLDLNKHLNVESIERVSEYRKAHHISQISVTESSGRRYIYGIPVYNIVQKDFSFTVSGNANPDVDLAAYDYEDSRTQSPFLAENAQEDGYVQVTEMPAYAHSFLLSGLLSPDYVDVKNDGITEDDLGTAIKFNYTRIKQDGDWAVHKWRTPHGAAGLANFNAGNRTETKDDKGLVSYGERESWYLHSIESKTMIAVFRTANRDYDGKGVFDEYGGVDASDNSLKKLDRIDLYNKADLRKNGEAAARPIKSVHFSYSYKLCPGTPDNYLNQTSGVNAGKLTLEKIWFTYNGQSREDNQYLFSYGDNETENPSYARSSSDRWGNYKPASANPAGMTNRDYPYSVQDRAEADQYVGAWSLRKVLLPSGGQMQVEYESDDYAYVQNLRAGQMMQVLGLGTNPSTYDTWLYRIFSNGAINEKDYVFIKTPQECAEKKDVFKKYLEGQTQLAFKIAVPMPRGGYEYIPCYAFYEDYGRLDYDKSIIWIKIKRLDGVNPISLAAVDYLREQLPGQAFPGYDLSEGNLADAAAVLLSMVTSLRKQLQSPILTLRQDYKASKLISEKSFVRLNNPNGFKLGGGYRVKSIKLQDNWKAMNGKYNSIYGQVYEYTTEELLNDTLRQISSGVASYEPGIGGEENPFQRIMQVADQLPMGPVSYGAVEMPVLDAFFPAPLVGYSKVTVRSLPRTTPLPEGKKSKSGIGRQVTEFFTARDYPVSYAHSLFDEGSDKQTHWASRFNFFHKSAYDYRALSQGFVVATNDMHGQLKAQSSYSEKDPLTRINYTRNYYRNTGEKGLAEKFDFVHATSGGEVIEGNMGIDIELMTDAREFSVKSYSEETQANVDLFFIGVAVIPFFLGHNVTGKTENTYRAVTTTKVVSYHAVLDSVLVIDKGSAVSTRNLVYDAETGSVVVSRTNNEFDKFIYNVNYPAYWAYRGMGLASDNIDAVFTNVDFVGGKVMSGNVPLEALESGDEVYIIDPGSKPGSDCGNVMASKESIRQLWVYDSYKNTDPAGTNHDFFFIDEKGMAYTRSDVAFRIIRSGKRNMLGASVAGVALMGDPVRENPEERKFLIVDQNSRVITASAGDFRERWQTDNNIIRIVTPVYDPLICDFVDVDDCNGSQESSVNPYRKGLLGNFHASKNFTFYGDRVGKDISQPLNLPTAGFLDQFQLYWTFSGAKLDSVASPKWIQSTGVSRFNSKGMELETYDAMGIFTSAQYGYNKSTPVAIANNSRYNEMFAEGFEEAGYDEMVRDVTLACRGKHVTFPQPVNALNLGFKAHTGKNVLPVSANSTVAVQFPIGEPASEEAFSFSEKTGRYFTGGDPGGQLEYLGVPDAVVGGEVFEYVLTPFDNFGNVLTMEYRYNTSCGTGSCVTNNLAGNVELRTVQYMNVAACGTYDLRFRFNSGLGPEWGTPVNGDTTTALVNTLLELKVYTIDNVLMHWKQVPFSIHELDATYPLDLAPGVYRVEFKFWHRAEQGGTGMEYSNMRDVWTGFYINPPSGSGLPEIGETYSDVSMAECTGTGGITTADDMMNPVFSMEPGQKMVFSAWVKGNCNNVTTMCSNKVRLEYEGGSTQVDEFNPAGPLIEGWQRYEGVFTVPATGANAMNLKLMSTGASPVYFDDIRIHPFNANMKSFVYDPVSLRLVAELDANNYATFYDYDPEGILVRTKAETREGVKTISESRSSKQKNITEFQEP